MTRRIEVEVDGVRATFALLEEWAPRTTSIIWEALPLENQVLPTYCIQHKISTRPNRYDFAVHMRYIIPVCEYRTDERNPTNTSQR